MPIFEYVCRECNHRFELLLSRVGTSRVSEMPGHDTGKTIFLVRRGGHGRVGAFRWRCLRELRRSQGAWGLFHELA